MGMLAYSALSPVVVAYAFLIAGTGGLLLASVSLGEPGSGIGSLMETVLVVNLVWIDRLWDSSLTFEANAMRLFGTLGFLGWLIEVVLRRLGWLRYQKRLFLSRVKRSVMALAVLTLTLCTLLFTAMLSVEWAGDPSLTRRVFQGGLTAFGMGAIIFAFSVPALVLSLGIQASRGLVAQAVASAAVVWSTERSSPTPGSIESRSPYDRPPPSQVP